MKLQFIRAAQVRRLIVAHNRRAGADFLATLDQFVKERVERACAVHNGGKVTLDPTVAGFVGIKPRGDRNHE